MSHIAFSQPLGIICKCSPSDLGRQQGAHLSPYIKPLVLRSLQFTGIWSSSGNSAGLGPSVDTNFCSSAPNFQSHLPPQAALFPVLWSLGCAGASGTRRRQSTNPLPSRGCSFRWFFCDKKPYFGASLSPGPPVSQGTKEPAGRLKQGQLPKLGGRVVAMENNTQEIKIKLGQAD